MPDSIERLTSKEHKELLNLIGDLTKALLKLPRDIQWGNSTWAHDLTFRDMINFQIASVISTKETILRGCYRDAYNAIRMLYESYWLLRLISTCDKYSLKYKVERTRSDRSLNDAKEKFKQQAIQRLGRDLKYVKDLDKNTIELVLSGIRVVDDQGNDTGVIIPFYYHAWSQYRPERHFLNRRHLNMRRFLQSEWAIFRSIRAKLETAPHRDFYREFFSFNGLVEKLRLNGALNKKTATRVLVHYNFLSSFSHTTKTAIDSIKRLHSSIPISTRDKYGRIYDHYHSELALLYVCHLLAMHTELALYYFRQWRHIRVKNVRKIYQPLCQKVQENFGYFWFIFNQPHEFDRFEQANRKSNILEGVLYRPEQIRPRDVRYYDDPLDRLIKMHSSTTELSSGNRFISPFNRGHTKN